MRKCSVDVYAQLRKRIVLGEFPSGAQLKELPLTQELGVSRSPLRAAFKRLAADGLVVVEPNRGVFVAGWTRDDDDDVFDLRILIEAHGARLAATRRQPEHLEQLHALNAAMESLIQNRPEDFLHRMEATNRQFHTVVAQAASSTRLASIMRSLFGAQRLTGFFFASDAQIHQSLADHRDLTRAIERGDASLAHALMASHIQHTWDRLKAQRLRPEEAAAAAQS
jgi:DNA-binding GntR family transcriptional regulator